jgi:Spy/CpxP family protein refolding chaperone
MKKYLKWTAIASVVLLAGGLAAGITLADPDKGVRKARWGRGHGNPIGWMKKNLELTDEQTTKIMDIVTESRKKNVKVRADLRVAKIELGQLLTQTEVDKAAVNQKIGQIGQTTQQMIRNMTDGFFEVREVLTPEQREKAKPMIQGMLSRGGHFRGHHGRGGGRGHYRD